jgi:hypothetical protein
MLHTPCRAGRLVRAGVHEQRVEVCVIVSQRLMPQPGNQFVAVGCVENLTERLKTFALAHLAGRKGEQVQIVIAKHGNRRVTERFYKSECFQRFGPAVDEVTRKPERVVGGVEADGVEEGPKRIVTSLQITDRIDRHD